MIAILLQLIQYSLQSQLEISVTFTGCTDQSCDRICRLGQSNCDDQFHPQCEFGYFKFSTQYGWDCIECPYANINDGYSYKCMDCIENPLHWENNRQCTFEYKIYNGNPITGTYVKTNLLESQIFYINKASTPIIQLPYRDTILNYEVYQCSGCDKFCYDEYDESCHFLDNSLDTQEIAIICLDKYYFENDQCLPCLQENCLECDNLYCYQCVDGYSINYDYTLCIQCFVGCSSCYIGFNEFEEQISYCFNCIPDQNGDLRIISLDSSQCLYCGQSCKRCEYMSTNSDLFVLYPNRDQYLVLPEEYVYYIKKCRQCSYSNQMLSYDGESCEFCYISNCLLCFYEWDEGNTLQLNFQPYIYGDFLDQKCQQCEPGYQISLDKLSCIKMSDFNYCVSKDQNDKCQRCKAQGTTEFLLEVLSNNNIKCSLDILCSQRIQNCISCISFIQDSKLITQCSKCNDGYYPDFKSGICLQCQKQCKQCWEYTLSYNLTEYMLFQMPARNPEQFIIDQEKILGEDIFDPQCTLCNDGYGLYDNQCKGCSENCYKMIEEESAIMNVVSACEFQQEFGYCSQCFNPFTQRSLIQDNSECLTCPEYCQACRERTIEERNIVNQLFNPSSDQLHKYGNYCYKLQNQLPTQLIYLDSTLGIPVSCIIDKESPPITDPKLRARKCIKKISFQSKIDCQSGQTDSDYKLSDFSTRKESTTNIYFDSLDNQENYLKWNQETITEMTLILKFYSNGNENVCNFYQPTQIITQVFQNVFTLQNLNIELIGYGGQNGQERVLFKITDYIKFENYAFISFQNIDFVNNENSQLRIISINDKTAFSIKNSKIYSNIEYPPEITFQIKNCNYIYMENILIDMNNEISNLPIIQLTQSEQFQISHAIFKNIILQKFNLNDTYFFQLNQMAKNNIVKVQQFQILQSTFNTSAIFKDYDKNGITSFIASKIKIIQTDFIDSTFLSSFITYELKFKNIQIIASSFQQYSIFLDLPLINIENLFVYSCTISDNASLIESAETIYIKENTIQLQEFSLNQAKFQQISCSSQNCLIKITAPSNYFSIYPNIILTNIELKSVQIMNMTQEKQQSVNSALISIYNFGTVTLNNITVIDTISITILYFTKIHQFHLGKLLYDWQENNVIEKPPAVSIDNGVPIQNNADEGNLRRFRMLSEVEYIQNPKNNLIPVNLECAGRKQESNSFTYYLLYISDFKYKVVIEDVTIQRQLFMNSGSIYIGSYDILEQIENEIIKIQGITMIFNNMVSTKSGADMALIQINSNQNQSISIESSKFSSNHLHQLVSAQLADTPTCLLIKSPYSSLIMNDVQFYYNRATQSGNGINYIKISELTIKNCQFRFTNAMDVIWLKRIEESQLNGKDQLNNLKSYFEILSLGSNLNVVTQSLLIQQTEVFESYGLNGGAFYITMFSNACQTQCSQSLKLENVKFTNIISSLEPKYQTKGGCLFLNSQIDQLNINFSTIQMSNCTARANGGCIYMAPSINSYKMNVENSLFAKCQSLLRSVFNLQYLGVYNTPQLILTNVIIRENNFAEFLENLPDLSVQEKQQLISNNFDDSLFAQTRGSIIIRNSLIENVKYICLIHATNLIELVIYNSIFMNNILFYAPLFYFSFIDTNSTASIVNSGFLNNTSDIKSIDSNLSCEIDFKQQFTFIYSEQTCETIQNNQQYIQDVDNYNYVPLNSDIYVKQYQEMTYSEKFTFDQTYSIIYDEQENLIQFIYPSQRWDFIICLLQEQLLSINTKDFFPQTSILIIPQLNYLNQVIIAKVEFSNNKCMKCYGGLLQIKSISYPNFITKSFINLIKFECQNNLVGYYGCIVLTSNYELTQIIPQQNLIDLPVQGQRLLQNENKEIYACIISDSTFYGNSAKVGPSITSINISVSLFDNLFINNQASLIGGGIYFKGSAVVINNETFENNKAQVGGAIYLDGASLGTKSDRQIQFKYNEAQTGANTLENTLSLTIQLKEGSFLEKQPYMESLNINEDQITVYDMIKENISLPYSVPQNFLDATNLLILPSGQKVSQYKYFYEYTQEYIPFDYVFRIINLNSFNEPIIKENEQQQEVCLINSRIQNVNQYDDQIIFRNNYTYPYIGYYNSAKGGFDFDNVIIYFDPYSPPELYLELKIICSSVKIPIYNQEPPYQIIQYNTNYELFARIRTYQCQKGEVYQSGKCIPCKPENNQYSVILNAQFCSSFNSDYMEDIKQSSIKLRKGFWRPYFNNDQTEYCTNLASNCLGGWIPGDPSCYEGHIGGLCESCDLYAISNDEKYTQTSPFVCGGCKPTEQYNMIVLIATTLVSFVSMVFAVKGTYEQSQLLLARDTCHMMGILVRSTISDLATLMKMLTNYFQIIQFIGTFQLNIPPSLISAAQTVGNPTKSTATSLDCLFTTLSETNVLYFRMIWGLLQPAMYLIGFYLIYLLLVLFRILPFKINVITTALIYQFLLLQPTFVDGFIVLASSRIISGIPYIQRDVAYRYDSETHQIWMLQFILPMLFVWAIALPLLLRFLLWRKRKLLQDKSVKLIYGFFYSEYTEKSYSWEFMKIFSKEVMVIIIAYYSQKVIVKGLLCVVVLYIYGTYLVQIGPYRNRRLNKLDLYSTLSLSMSLCLGVLMKGTQDYEFWYLFYLISIILVLINVPFLMMIVYYLLENYFMEFSPLIDKIRDKVDSKYPNLKYKNNFIRKLLLNQEKMHLRGKYLWKVLRDSVEETRQLSKENQLQFGQVFPPYIQINQNEFQIVQNISEISELISYKLGTENEQDIQQKQKLYTFESKSKNRKKETQIQLNFRNIKKSNMQDNNSIQLKEEEKLKFLEDKEICLNFENIIQLTVDESIINQQRKEQNNNSYSGEIVDGKKNGQGLMIWNQLQSDIVQEYYKGQFKNDMFDGFGIYQYSNGARYQGNWKMGFKEGYGELIFKERSYQGQFKQDKFCGHGQLKIGKILINGEWTNGILNGKAIIELINLQRKSYWENGQFKKWQD